MAFWSKVTISLGAVLIVGLLAASPARAFSSIANAEGVAVASLLAGGGEIAAVTGAGVAAAEVGVAATSAGTIAGIATTGAIAAAAAGLSIRGGGLPDWEWWPDSTRLDQWGTPAGYPPFTSTDWVTSGGTAGNFTLEPTIIETGQTYDFFVGRQWLSHIGYIAYDLFVQCVNDPGTWVPAGGVLTGGSSPGTGVQIVSGSKCSALGGFLPTLKVHPYYGGSDYIWEAVTPANLTGTIETTVTCNRSDGTSYQLASSTPFEGLTISDTVTVAGLECDPGDFASDAGADLTHGGYSDPLTQTPTFSPGWDVLPDPDKTTAVDPTTSKTIKYDNVTNVTNITNITNITNVDPGTDPGPSESFCGFSFGDLLSGLIVFKAVGCAMDWAFVPSDGFMETQVQTVTSSWNTSSVGTFTNAAVAVPLGLASIGSVDGGCAGPTFTVPLVDPPVTVQPLNACDEPMATVAMWVRIVSTVVIVIMGVLFVAYPILRAFGMPQLRQGGSDGD